MAAFRAVDRDVFRSGQGWAADALIDHCEGVIDGVVTGFSRVSSGVGVACGEFQGYFRGVFDANLRVFRGDGEGLVDALRRLQQGIRMAKEAAGAEQRRIDRALVWQREHDLWEAKRRDGFVRGVVHDAFYSEPVLDARDMRVGQPPQIPAGSLGVRFRDTPVPGSVAGRSGVSSACPDDLDVFVRVVRECGEDLRGRVARLRSAWEIFESVWTWKTGARAISGMEDLLGVFERYVDNNLRDGEWVSIISEAFRRAGQGGVGVVSLSDQALFVVLQNAGVNIYRQSLEIPALSLVGMVPSTGFADDPVNTVSGAFVEPEMDLRFGGGCSGLEVKRVYNSVVAAAQFKNTLSASSSVLDGSIPAGVPDGEVPDVGVFGPGWFSVFDQGLVFSDEMVKWVGDDGRQVWFQVGCVDNVSERVRAERDNFWLEQREFDASVLGRFFQEKQLEIPAGFCSSVNGGSGSCAGMDGFGLVWVVSGVEGCEWVFSLEGDWLGVGFAGGGVVWVERDGQGLVCALVHGRGRRIEIGHKFFDVCAGYRVEWVRGSDGSEVSYSYDERGILVETWRDGLKRVYGLGLSGLIERVDYAGVVECVNEYDQWGRVVSQESSSGRVSRFAYLPGGVCCVSDEDGSRANTWVNDGCGRCVGIVDSDGYRVSMSYDEYGNLVYVRDREGGVKVNKYNQQGRLVRSSYPTGEKFDYVWDECNRLVEIKRDEQILVSYSYKENASFPCRVREENGGVSELEWDSGLLTRIVDPTGVWVEFGYDEYGDLTEIIRKDRKIVLERDKTGRVVKQIMPSGVGYAYEYDHAGRLLAYTSPDQARWEYQYNHNGKLVKIIDPYQAVTSYEYGPDGQVSKIINPLGQETTYTYDDLGNPHQIQLPENITWTYTHDALSRLKQITNPLGHQTTIDYTPNGVPTSINPTSPDNPPASAITTPTLNPTNPASNVQPVASKNPTPNPDTNPDTDTDTDVDASNDSIASSVGAGNEVDGLVSEVLYDQAGRVVKLVTGDKVLTCNYDELGMLVWVKDQDQQECHFDYDQNLRLCQVVYPDGAKASFTYDECGRVTGGYMPGMGRFERGYDKCGRLVYSRDLLAGKLRYYYDRAGRLEKVVNGIGGQTRYHYDQAGRITALTDPLGNTTTMTYNQLGKLTCVTDPLGRTTTATYDLSGQQLSQTSPDQTLIDLTQPTDKPADKQAPLNSDSLNPLPTPLQNPDSLVEGLEYDTWGRIKCFTSKGKTYQYEYDEANQLIKASDSSERKRLWDYNQAGFITSTSYHIPATKTDPAQNLTEEYIYDQAGQLKEKIVKLNDKINETITYTYTLNGQRACSKSSTGEKITYQWNKNGYPTTITIEKPDQPTQTITPLNHPHPIDIGKIKGAWTGILANPLNPAQASNPLNTSSTPTTSPLGGIQIENYHWLGTRLYDPQTYSFLSPDPYPNPEPGRIYATNPYNYANNNPLTFTDPTGYKPITDAELQAYMQGRSQSFFDRLADNLWSWNTLIGVGLIGIGSILVFTGFGTFAGGVLISAGVQGILEQAFTGEADWMGIAITSVSLGVAGNAVGRVGKRVFKTKAGKRIARETGEFLAALPEHAGFAMKQLGKFTAETAKEGISNGVVNEVNRAIGREHTSFTEAVRNGAFGVDNLASRIGAQGLELGGRKYYGAVYDAGAPIQLGNRGYNRVDNFLGEKTFGYDPRTSSLDPNRIYALGEHYLKAGDVKSVNFEKTTISKQIVTYEYQHGPTGPLRTRDVRIYSLPWQK